MHGQGVGVVRGVARGQGARTPLLQPRLPCNLENEADLENVGRASRRARPTNFENEVSTSNSNLEFEVENEK